MLKGLYTAEIICETGISHSTQHTTKPTVRHMALGRTTCVTDDQSATLSGIEVSQQLLDG